MEKISLDKFNEFIKLNKLQEAEIEINKLLLIDNNNHLLLSYLGNLLFHKGKIPDAIEKFKQSINIKPEYYQNYSDISLCFISLKKFDEVIFFLEEYIKYKNDNCDVYNNLGLAFLETNKLDDAVNCFNKCLSLKFDYIQAYNNLGFSLFKKKKINEAILILEQGIKIDSKFNSLYFNLAKCFIEKNQVLQGIKILKDNLHNNETNKEYLDFLATKLFQIGQISEGIKLLDKSLKIKENGDIYLVKIMNYLYQEDINFENYFNDIAKLKNIYNKKYLKKNYFKSFELTDKIKVGFISGDFREHVINNSIFDVMKILSKNNDFQIYVYSNVKVPDTVTEDYKSFLKNWNDVKHLTDDELIDLIRSHSLNIIVDLSGFTFGNRMPIFFCRVAPVQVSWCGYLSSTGMQIDYMISDEYSVPLEDEQKYMEKIYRLSKIWSVYKLIDGPKINNETPALKNNYISFASFNNIKKINIKVIELWSKILSRIENSRLYLSSYNFQNKDFVSYFKNFFINFGAKEKQLYFEDSIPKRLDFLNKYNLIDIALDTFPYNGMTTSFDSYSMCVPVLTVKGNHFISRAGYSINSNINLNNWTASDLNDYLSKAISFSKDLNFLQNTKNYLINNRNKFVIFDSEHLAEELSLAFKSMLKNYKSA